MSQDKILEVNNLTVSFKTDNGLVKAVRGVSFDLSRGETLCIVGESGSGKSVTSKAIMGILANNAVVEDGEILYSGENLLEISEEEFHKIRGNKIGMIFQDPLSSLNPIVRIGKQITEATILNGNKLKKMYEELISNELVQYKNYITKSNIKIEKLIATRNKKIEEANKDKAVIASAKKECKDQISLIKKDLKQSLPALKTALSNSKKVAKTKVKEYKKQVNIEHKEKKNLLNSKLKDSKADYVSNFGALTKYNLLSCVYKFALKLLKFIGMENKTCFTNLKNKVDNNNAEFNENFKVRNEILNEIELEKEHYISCLKISKKEAKRRALEIMREVGIPLPEKRYRQYPFEFSGGMRQRIVIAIALTATPEILICDEPTTALDVTIQAQILELIQKIQRERNIGCIFITHDLGVVANMADRVAVMYAGKIVEYGTSEEIFFDPKHPYTWALLSSIPDVDSKERLDAIPGTPPNMIYPPKGDAFALRSKYAMKIDFEQQPPYFKVSDTHYAATWLLHPNAPKVKMPKIVSERIKIALENEKNKNLERKVANE